MGVLTPFIHRIENRLWVMDDGTPPLAVEEIEVVVGDKAEYLEDGVGGGVEASHLEFAVSAYNGWDYKGAGAEDVHTSQSIQTSGSVERACAIDFVWGIRIRGWMMQGMMICPTTNGCPNVG
jgi:hypothetical protein